MFNRFFDGFISYGRADSKSFAAKLQNDLSEAGFNLWFDQNDIPLGVDFQNQIDDGIEKSHNFLYVIAPHAVNSPYCLKEVVLALKRNKRIIPLLHVEKISYETWLERNPHGTAEAWEAYQAAGTHSSFQNMHPTIGKINWIYFREGIDDYQESLAGLISLMHRHEDYVAQHTFLLAKALEWERNHNQTRLLLSGDERRKAVDWLLYRFKEDQPPCLPTDLHCEYICESEKNATNQLTDVFLSYSEHDKDIMEQIAVQLMREGKTIWRNTTDIRTGTEFQQEINRGIERADNVVFLISADSLESIYCQQELEYAAQLNKRFISLLVRPLDIEKIPEQWRSLQFIDISQPEDETQYRQGMTRLIKVIQEDSVYHHQHKAILVQALKWRDQGQNASILCRGYNLTNAQAWLTLADKHPRYPALPIHLDFIAASAAQPPDQSLDVFISYSRADADFARDINESLQLQGKTAWFDQESIASGADFQQEIHRGIEQCDNFLFIISPDAIDSAYCVDEVEFAASLNKRFVTVLHRPVAEDKVHPAFANLQWIDFKRHNGDFNANFSDLIRTLDLDRDHVKSHTKWLQRSLEWEQKGKGNDMLLRGSEFSIAQQWLEEAKEQAKQPPATALQQEFIGASLEAIATGIRREKRQKTILKSLLGLVSVVATIAVGVGIVAIRQNRALKVSEIRAIATTTKAVFALNDQLTALQQAILAGTKLQDLGDGINLGLTTEVEDVLRQTVYGSRILNRLSGHKAPVMSVVYSPSGKYVASASVDNLVKLWRNDGSLVHTFEGHNDSVLAIAFSPDEKIIATGGVDRVIKLWRLDGKLITTLVGHLDQVNGLEFSPDGTKLISASGDKTAQIWDVKTGDRLQTLIGHENKVMDAQFSPDGQKIATASQDKTVKLWSLDGKLLHTLQGHTDKVTAIAFSPNGKNLVSVSNDQSIKLWDSNTGELLREISSLVNTTSHTGSINDVVFSNDGRYIITGSDDNTLKIWSPEGFLLTTLAGHTDKVTHVDLSPDHKTIVSSSLDNSVLFWQWQGTDLTKLLYGHSTSVTGIEFSQIGKEIYSVGKDRLIKEWNWDKKEPSLQIFAHEQVDNTQLLSLGLSPDEKLLITGDVEGNISYWKSDGTFIKTIHAHQDDVMAIAFSPDGQTFATAGRDKLAKVWDREGHLITPLNGHTDAVTDIAFSKDGKFIATASWDNTVRIWNRQGKLLHIFEGHKGSVLTVAISPDSRLLASGGGDNLINIWDVEKQTLVKTLTGHSDSVYIVFFSPDGKTLASGSGDHTIKLWNIATGELITTLQGHQDDVLDLSFSPDGKTLVSGSDDHTVIVWDATQILSLDQLLVEACQWTNNYLLHNDLVPKGDRQLCNDIITPPTQAKTTTP